MINLFMYYLGELCEQTLRVKLMRFYYKKIEKEKQVKNEFKKNIFPFVSDDIFYGMLIKK